VMSRSYTQQHGYGAIGDDKIDLIRRHRFQQS
jgi:hypothetical protein